MKNTYFRVIGLLLYALVCALPHVSQAQAQAQNWYFGDHAAVRFDAAGPVALTNGAMVSYEGCATLSDLNGQLLAYSNGEAVWDSQHQMMPNGKSGLGGHNSTSQSSLLLPLPGSLTKVYLFGQDAIDNDLVGGLRYSILDFALRGGLGDVTSTKGVVLPTPTVGGRVTEKMTAVRHANGRDYWVVVHGWQSNAFYSFLLSPTGIATAPVVSNAGSVHQGGGSFFGDGNAIGCIKASPDGKRLALAKRDDLTELYDFDNATGQVSNYIPLQASYYNYGVEFSPDNSRLYVALILDGQIIQYNLQAGSAAAVRASARVVGTGNTRFGSLQRGPDDRIYVAAYNSNYLDVISNPNALGTACGYRTNAVSLGGKIDQNGLPNMPNAFAALSITAAFTSTVACANAAVSFSGATTPVLTTATASWNFGDPASGSANTATGFTPTHVYKQAGTYQATLAVSYPGLTTPVTITQAVTVVPLPQVRLGRDTTLCGTQLLLSAGAQPAGSTYRWQDGTTSATYLARASGRYRVAVTSAAGCTSTDSVRVTLNALPTPRLPADTLNCAASVLLRPGTQPAGSTYRWQDGSTSATYLAQSTGTYSVSVTTPQGCTSTATSRVQLGQAPVVQLGADTLVCPNAVWVLRTNSQPAGTLYRWQDGSTAPTYVAHGPGQYSVQVRASASSCPATATRVAAAANCPIVIPNIITPNGDPQNEFFTLKGLTPADWHLSVFDRWGRQVYDQTHYDNRWNAAGQATGIYYYLLSNASTGERYQGWVEVMRGS